MKTLPPNVTLKIDLLFDGVRYSEALSKAMTTALPNFYPYKFAQGEPNPTGQKSVPIPYLMDMEDETMVRVKGNRESPYRVDLAPGGGFTLVHDDGRTWPVSFEPKPRWMLGTTSDGTPMSSTGVSLHGDMLIINLAPACQYFVAPKIDGRSQRCAFCYYGRPDARTKALGQRLDDPLLPDWSLRRMTETVNAAVAEGGVRHVYLVAGSMLDWEDEARRYVQLASAVRDACPDVPYLTCGSGALPHHALQTLHHEGLVDGVCFNLEVYGADLFERVCPGKSASVGYERWLASLERAVELWGPGNVYSAMVSGIEMEPEFGDMPVDQAVDRVLEGADDLLARGIIPIHSLYWPLGGKDYRRKLANLRDYFERIQVGYLELRRARGLYFNPDFMCHRCSYMQVECDLDRGASG